VTIERKIVLELDDINAVVFKCRKCGARVCLDPDHAQVPAKCLDERCDSDHWIKGQSAEMSSNLIAAIKDARKKKDGAAFTILLEFEDPQENH